jgi:hypothetical protein
MGGAVYLKGAYKREQGMNKREIGALKIQLGYTQ